MGIVLPEVKDFSREAKGWVAGDRNLNNCGNDGHPPVRGAGRFYEVKEIFSYVKRDMKEIKKGGKLKFTYRAI